MTTTEIAEDTRTAGRKLADALRQNFKIGTRTRRYGKVFGSRTDLHAAMIESIRNANNYPGYYGPEKTAALAPGFTVALAYGKHVAGCRIDGVLARRINEMSAYRFAELLGRMVDAGVTNVGEGERFFQEMARETA